MQGLNTCSTGFYTYHVDHIRTECYSRSGKSCTMPLTGIPYNLPERPTYTSKVLGTPFQIKRMQLICIQWQKPRDTWHAYCIPGTYPRKLCARGSRVSCLTSMVYTYVHTAANRFVFVLCCCSPELSLILKERYSRRVLSYSGYVLYTLCW